MTTPILVTAKRAAEILGIGLREIRRLVKAGELDIRYIGEHNAREYRITYASLVAYADSLPVEPRRSA